MNNKDFFSWAIGLMSRVFTNGLGNRGSIPGRVIPKTQKMVLDPVLLNTQHYNVRIKGKVEQSREWSTALPYTLKREPLGHPQLRLPTLLYNKDLALNNLQGLTCHKTQPNDLAAPDAFPEVVKWQTILDCGMLSSPDTLWVFLYGLEHNPRIQF